MGLTAAGALVTSSIDACGVRTITLNDPSSGNALSEAMVADLSAALEEADQDVETTVVLLTGRGETFSSGAPRELLEKLMRGEGRPSDITLPRLLFGCSVPIIAAMDGHATGGGFALGLAADIVLLARESRYGFPFMNMGFTPGMGTTRLCEHVLSPAVAHELLYSGELRRGAAFDRTGVNAVLPRADIQGAALDLAHRIAEKPRTSLAALKRTLSLPRRTAFEASLTLESLMHQVTLHGSSAARLIEEGYA
jgi:polyketide biosynthesis enoyl-CoA hydratase PksI